MLFFLLTKYRRSISLFLVFVFVAELVPYESMALTGGNSMPEYRSFEPVSTTNMVNPFSGGLTYNIPLLNIPNGYPINLSYHSNEITNEAEASWVGLGWSLNPGAINRIKKGFPDEYKGVGINYYNKAKVNRTVSVSLGAAVEFFGKELPKDISIGNISAGKTLTYNNYTGFGTAYNIGIGAPLGLASLNFSYSKGRLGFTPSINPAAILSLAASRLTSPSAKSGTDNSAGTRKQGERETFSLKDQSIKTFSSMAGSTLFPAIYPMKPSPSPISVNEYSGWGGTIKFNVGLNPLPIPSRVELNTAGSYMQQENVASSDKQAYGYMHTEKANAENMTDFYLENESSMGVRDRYMSVPFANNDMFNMSGEAMGGTFRAYRTEVGYYKKNNVISTSVTGELGLEANYTLPSAPPIISAAFGPGGGGGGGGFYSEMEVNNPESDWVKSVNDLNFNRDMSANQERFIIRYDGDLAVAREEGSFIQSAGGLQDEAVNVSLVSTGGRKEAIPNKSQIAALRTNRNTERHNYLSSTHVSMRTNKESEWCLEKEFKVKTTGSWSPLSSGANNAVPSLPEEATREIVTYNKEGVRYVYGLPLITKNEKQLTYGMPPEAYDHSTGSLFKDTEGQLVYPHSSDPVTDTKVGYEITDGAYASQFLLTQINGPDYIDKNANGFPDAGDYGSFTRFYYKKVADDYTYRSPFKGLSFNAGTLSSEEDNLGSFSSGQKQLYYLYAVASKTHVAFFETSPRKDGCSANATAQGNKSSSLDRLQRLDKIDMYAIGNSSFSYEQPEKVSGMTPLQTVHFDYDYSLCKGIPNTSDQSATDNGKLKLKKVWFTYGGKQTAYISPYEFEYENPAFHNKAILTSSKVEQNPDYEPGNTDAWGFYRNLQEYSNVLNTPNHELSKFFPYVLQRDQGADFDPAAWCLKKITLPGEGEIHVKYEQNDYAYVQDKKAMVMVPLDGTAGATPVNEGSLNEDKKYFLDLSKAGIAWPATTAEREKALGEMLEPMIQRKERIYFSFLYRLLGNALPTTSASDVEYIEGYVRIQKYGLDGNGRPWISFGDPSEGHRINYPSGASRFEIPFRACEDFYRNQRRGLVNNGNNSLASGGPSENMLLSTIDRFLQIIGISNVCAEMSPKDSFVRIQVPHTQGSTNDVVGKKGGGVRVKQIFMYDSATEELYGNEYKYHTTTPEGKTISSGVATNEPGGSRRESPFVKPLDRDDQSGIEALFFGRDMYGNEGPIGETLLPGASVGYSRVETHRIYFNEDGNINNSPEDYDKSGYEVQEYYTCKDYPMLTDKTNVARKYPIPTTPRPMGTPPGDALLSPFSKKEAPHHAQGYVFEQNDMHGKPHRTARFPYGSQTPVYEETLEYYDLTNKIRIMDEDMKIEEAYLGKTTEMLGWINEMSDYSIGGEIYIDVLGGVATPVFPPVPLPFFFGTRISASIKESETLYRSHVLNKIISRPSVLKKKTVAQNGISHVTENLIFDRYTGDPVITRQYDEYNNSMISQNIPASWFYDGMRSKSIGEGEVFGINGLSGPIWKGVVGHPGGGYNTYGVNFKSWEEAGGNPCGPAASFNGGDIVVVGTDNSGEPNWSASLLMVGASDPAQNEVTLGLMPGSAAPPTNAAWIKVLRSGRTNQLAASTGQSMAISEATAADLDFSDMGDVMKPERYESDFTEALTQAHNSAINNGSYSNPFNIAGSFDNVLVDELQPCNLTDLSDYNTLVDGSKFGSSGTDSRTLSGLDFIYEKDPQNENIITARPASLSYNYNGQTTTAECEDCTPEPSQPSCSHPGSELNKAFVSADGCDGSASIIELPFLVLDNVNMPAGTAPFDKELIRNGDKICNFDNIENVTRKHSGSNTISDLYTTDIQSRVFKKGVDDIVLQTDWDVKFSHVDNNNNNVACDRCQIKKDGTTYKLYHGTPNDNGEIDYDANSKRSGSPSFYCNEFPNPSTEGDGHTGQYPITNVSSMPVGVYKILTNFKYINEHNSKVELSYSSDEMEHYIYLAHNEAPISFTDLLIRDEGSACIDIKDPNDTDADQASVIRMPPSGGSKYKYLLKRNALGVSPFVTFKPEDFELAPHGDDITKAHQVKFDWKVYKQDEGTDPEQIHKKTFNEGGETNLSFATVAFSDDQADDNTEVIVRTQQNGSLSTHPSGDAVIGCITGKDSDGITVTKWTGSNQTDQKQNGAFAPKFQLVKPGNYRITLTISRPNNSGSITKSIDVYLPEYNEAWWCEGMNNPIGPGYPFVVTDVDRNKAVYNDNFNNQPYSHEPFFLIGENSTNYNLALPANYIRYSTDADGTNTLLNSNDKIYYNFFHKHSGNNWGQCNLFERYELYQYDQGVLSSIYGPYYTTSHDLIDLSYVTNLKEGELHIKFMGLIYSNTWESWMKFRVFGSPPHEFDDLRVRGEEDTDYCDQANIGYSGITTYLNQEGQAMDVQFYPKDFQLYPEKTGSNIYTHKAPFTFKWKLANVSNSEINVGSHYNNAQDAKNAGKLVSIVVPSVGGPQASSGVSAIRGEIVDKNDNVLTTINNNGMYSPIFRFYDRNPANSSGSYSIRLSITDKYNNNIGNSFESATVRVRSFDEGYFGQADVNVGIDDVQTWCATEPVTVGTGQELRRFRYVSFKVSDETVGERADNIAVEFLNASGNTTESFDRNDFTEHNSIITDGICTFKFEESEGCILEGRVVAEIRYKDVDGTWKDGQKVYKLTFNTEQLGIQCHQPICRQETRLPNNTGKFYVHKDPSKPDKYGQVYFVADGCVLEHPLNGFWEIPTPRTPPVIDGEEGFISASVTTFSDNWDTDNTAVEPHDYWLGYRGRWRPEHSFVYDQNNVFNGDREYDNAAINPAKDGGTIQEFKFYNWNADASVNGNNGWLRTNSVLSYDLVSGQPDEEENALGLHSTALYGRGSTVMKAVAQNAEKGTICYEGFEGVLSSSLITTSIAHTGLKGWTGYKRYNVRTGFTYRVRLWKHNGNSVPPECNTVSMNVVASSGEWSLYEMVNVTPFSTGIDIETKGGSVDDVRIQPMESEMTCYVYDEAERLIATFDDQHFALLYQYNDEGLLIRKQKETTERYQKHFRQLL